jgi:HSP20 family molecular chaperone IbpA
VQLFQLSSKIDQDRISAELQDGIITLALPKSEKAKPRKIKVELKERLQVPSAAASSG